MTLIKSFGVLMRGTTGEHSRNSQIEKGSVEFRSGAGARGIALLFLGGLEGQTKTLK